MLCLGKMGLVDDPELLVLEIGKVSRAGLEENWVLVCPLVTEESAATPSPS